MNETGKKFDNEKIRMDLLPFEALEAVAEVLTFGAKKYSDNNWQLVEDADKRYLAAMLRHLIACKKGEMIDSESGLSHLAHAATNMLFLLWFEIDKAKKRADDLPIIGHKYVVVANSYSHGFEIGDIVTCDYFDPEDNWYVFKDKREFRWGMIKQEYIDYP